MRGAAAAAWLLWSGLLLPGEAWAQEESAPRSAETALEEGGRLAQYLSALEARRLLTVEAASADELRTRVRRGEEALFDGKPEEAVRWLYEVVESPRFADFSEEEAFQAAEWWLATALRELGAMRSAERYVLRVLGRGPEARYFGPAFRTWTDVALEGGDPGGALARLQASGLDMEDLPDDALAELAYLRGRVAFDAGRLEEAAEHFEDIGARSRFHTQARFLLGVIHVRARDLGEAEAAFCAAAAPETSSRAGLFADARFLRVRDRAWLALGRIAHEQGRAEDAFYYYFQVPQDSERVAEALFEAAYAMYEGEDYETALDLLDQLQSRFPRTAAADEAALLRGYLYLGSCRFERADELFRAYQRRFEPVLTLVERWQANPAARARLVERLLRVDGARRQGKSAEPGTGEDEALGTLLAMLRVHPGFYRLHRAVATLDAEAARAGRISSDLAALAARMRGEDAPRALDTERQDWVSEAEALRRKMNEAQALLRAAGERLDALREAGARPDRLRPLRGRVAALARRVERLGERLGEVTAEGGAEPADVDRGSERGLEAMLEEDVARAATLPRRVAAVRARLLESAAGMLGRALAELRERLARGLRRARIGRIDAVMGSKRRIERQIESLAAGRYPPELVDPLRARGLLRDDEEYWPFEGEYWEDEFVEHDPAPEDGS